MIDARKLTLVALGALAVSPMAGAQTPDLLNAFDAGGRAMGSGGSFYTAGSDTLSTYYNPAGLAFARQRQFGLVYRNLPRSNTALINSFTNPTFDTSEQVGDRSITHIGYVQPMGRGTIGLSYTTGGYINDNKFNRGALSNEGGTVVQNYTERTKARVDFFTVAYGAPTTREELNWGVGLVVANASVDNNQSYQIYRGDGSLLSTVTADNSDSGIGFGAIAGLQYTPRNASNVSMGFSVRTPIDLTGNDSTRRYYDRVPGRISLGGAYRLDGLRGGRDFAILAAQVDGFYGGQRDKVLVRKRQIVVGGGIEYNYSMGGARIPLRIGFQAVPSGGPGFSERNAFTFGLGYRPATSPYAIDLNFASGSGSRGQDMAIGLTYRLDR